MNEDQFLFEQAQTLGAAAPSPANDDSAEDQFLLQEAHSLGAQSRQRDAVLTQPGPKPDEYAKALSAAEQLGIPPALADNAEGRQQLATFAEHEERRRAREALRETPELESALLADEDTFKLANDDLDTLGQLSTLWHNTKAKFSQGDALTRLGFLEYEEGIAGRSLTPDELAERERFKAQLAQGYEPTEDYGLFGDIALNTAEILGQQSVTVPRALKTGVLAGLGVGALTAVGSGGLATPAVPVTSLAALGAGVAAQSAADTFMIESGHAIAEFKGIRGVDGRELDPEVMKGAAAVAGLINAGVEVVGLDVLRRVSGISGVIDKTLVRKGISEMVLHNPSVRGALMKLGKATGLATLAEVGEEVIQELSVVLSGEAAKALSPGEFESIDAGDVVQRVADIAYKTATGSFLLGGAAATPAFVSDLRAADQAKDQKAFFDALADGSTNSKLRERMPAKYAQVIDRLAEGTGVDTVYVDARALVELFQSKGGTMADVQQALPSVAEQLPLALSGSGFVGVPIGEFAANIAGTDAYASLAEHIKTTENGFTQSEEKLWRANYEQEYQREVAYAVENAETIAQSEEPADRVFNDVTEKLKAAGVRETAPAALHRAFFKTLGERLGRDAFELYNENPFVVQSELTRAAGQERVTRLDLSLDRIRKGKLPTDRDVKGPTLLETVRERTGRREVPTRAPQGEEGLFDLPALAQTMADEGFIESPDVDTLLAAVERERAGEPSYSPANLNEAAAGEQQDINDLMELLDELGIDPATATNDEIKGALQGPLEDGEPLFQSTTLRSGAETLRKYGIDPKKRHNVRDIAVALERRQREKFGKIEIGDYSEEAEKKIARWMAAEVRFELTNPGASGVGWYAQKYQNAVDAFGQMYPELVSEEAFNDDTLPGTQLLGTVQNARDFFTALVAIASDGEKVSTNFSLASETYRFFRTNGRLPTTLSEADQGSGRATSLNINLARVQAYLDKFGPEGMHERLLGEDTVKNMRAAARAQGEEFTTDYEGHITLPYAALVFGSKLGAFYANLMGSHGYLTMDRWWSRAFNRYRGTLLPDVVGLAGSANEFDTKGRKQGLAKFKEQYGYTELSDEEALQGPITSAFLSYEAKGFKEGTPEEKSANTIHKAAFRETRDVPASASDRSFMLRTVARAATSLRRSGAPLSVADIQAVLWYYEKRLYGELQNKRALDISYEEVAKKLVREQGTTGARDTGERDAGVLAELAGPDGPKFDLDNETGQEAPAVSAAAGQPAATENVATAGPSPAPVPLDRLDVGGDAQRDIYGRFGELTGEDSTASLKFYDLDTLVQNPQRTEAFLRDLGFPNIKYFAFHEDPEAGVTFTIPRLTKDGYDQGTVWIYDPRVAHGSFKDVEYTRQWRIVHEAAHGITERYMQERYGDSNRYGRLGRPMEGERGKPPKRVKVELRPLTLAEAQRAVEWEDVAFRVQKMLMERLGVVVDPATFAQEYNTNISDATYRVLTGDFGNPGEYGFVPASTLPNLRNILEILQGTEAALAEEQGREPTTGVELETWEPVLDSELQSAIDERLAGQTLFQGALDGNQSSTAESANLRRDDEGSSAGDARRHARAVLPARPDGRVELEHWSFAPALERLTRDKHGTGIPGEESRRRRSDKSYQPRLYFALPSVYQREPALGPHKYTLSVLPDELYDISKDRELLNLYEAIRAKASKLLETPLTALENAILEAGFKGYFDPEKGVVVYFDDVTPEAYQDDRTLNQEGARGSIVLPTQPGVPTLVTLTSASDLSTFLHESGHYFLHTLQQVALQPNAPIELRQEWENIAKWLGAESPFATLSREQHEQWAEAFEMYLFEGNAPSQELQGAFAKFRSWLRALYKTLRDIGQHGKLDAEIRGIFDRMLASEEAINAAEARLNARPAVDELARALGLPKAHMERLQRLAIEAKEEALDQLERRVLGEVRKQRRKDYREARQAATEEVTQAMTTERQYVALEALSAPDSEVKLSREAIVRTLGSDAILSRLPGRGKRAVWRAEGGLAPDAVAPIYGYESGEQMLLDLANTPPLRDAVNAEVNRRLEEQFGDVLTDGSIGEEAAAAVRNHKRAQLLQAELDLLRNAAGSEFRVPPGKVTREIAERILGNSKVKHAVKEDVFATAEMRAGKAALRATVAGDYAEAARQKRIQLLNLQLAREARRVADFEKSAMRLARNLQKPAARKNIEQAYLDQIDKLLERFEFKDRSDIELDRREALTNWVNERIAEGLSPAIDEALLAEGQRINHKNLTVDQLRGVVDALKSISYLGRRHKELLALQEKRRLDELAEDLVNEARANTTWHDDPPALGKGVASKFVDGIDRVHAEHLRPEFAFSQLDGHKTGGLWWRAVFQPLAEAEGAEFLLMQEITPQLDQLFKLYSRTERATMLIDKRTFPALGKNSTLTKAERLMVALNWGNAGNRTALLEGYGWEDTGVAAVLDTLDARDWQFVQGIWDLIDSLWPQIAALQKDLSGVEPRKVEREPLDTRYGPIAGGYFPLVADSTQSYRAHQREEKQNVAELFGSNFITPQTRKGHTIERRGFGGQPVKLSFDVITQHIGNVVHDVTHRRALITVDKITQHKRVREAIEHTLGRQYYRTVRPWLANIAADQSPPSTSWTRVLSRARHGATIVNMGWKMTTMIVQPLGYLQSIDLLGEKWAMKGLAYYKHPARNTKFIMERSVYMRSRMKTFDRDVRDITKKVGVGGIKAEIDATYFAGIGLLDLSVSMPTWWGGYVKEMSQSGDERLAISAADSAVRQSQSAGGAKDLAAIQRNGELHRIFTMFYSYFSSLYGMLARRKALTRKPGDVPRAVLSAMYLLILPAVLSELVAGRAPDDDDEDGLLWWAFKKVAAYPAQAVVGLRDVVNALDGSGFGYSLSPVADVFKLTSDTVRGLADGELTESWLKAAWLSSSVWFQLPGRQLWITGKYLHDYMSGEVTDFSLYEALVTGDRD